MKILLAEDNEAITFLIRRFLQRLGYDDVTTVPNGAEALDLFLNDTYDLVITDWMMPLLDGISLVQEIRTLEKRPARDARHTPVIMVSVRDEEEDLDLAERAGVDAYITKPFERGHLREGIRQVLRDQRNPLP